MKPIIYQLVPRWFTNYNETRYKNGSREENGCGKFAQITPKALKAIYNLGVTHIWYTGVIRHATADRNNPTITKGKAGSPYAITDYYDVDPDLASNEQQRMDEFEALIGRTHKAGLKVVMDFVPNHVSREYKSLCKPKDVQDLGEGDHPEWAFSPLNNFYYLPNNRFGLDFKECTFDEEPAKVTGNDCFRPVVGEYDWYDTVKLNYGVFYQGGGEKQFSPIPNTWHKMLHILRFWAQKGIDAFRVDMAEMVPVEFWAWVIPSVRASFPHIQFIAECYNPSLYRDYINAGFDYLYDKVGMYDYLRGVTSKNWPVEGITGQWQCVDDIQEHMLYFLENHDEQRVASGFFCGRGHSAEPAMIVLATLGRNPIMIYSGQELGEKGMDMEGFSGMDGRTTIFDYWGVRSIQAWANNGKFDGKKLDAAQTDLRGFYQKLLTIARDTPAITDGLMYDLEYAQGEGFNKHEQFAFIRKYEDELLLVVANFDDKEVSVHVRVPREAFEYLHQPELDKAEGVDLLTGNYLTVPDSRGKEYKQIAFTSSTPIQISLPAWRGAIIKITSKTKKKK